MTRQISDSCVLQVSHTFFLINTREDAAFRGAPSIPTPRRHSTSLVYHIFLCRIVPLRNTRSRLHRLWVAERWLGV
jgi:hypothetical protein